MKRGWILGMMLVITLTFSSLAGAQSLAEAARKAKAKKDRPKATKVYTNKDIKKSPATTTTTTSTTTTSSPKSALKSQKSRLAALEERERAKKAWLQQYRQVRQRILKIKKRLKELDQEIRTVMMGYMGSDFPDQSEKLRLQVQNLQAEQKRLTEELAQAERTLSEIRRKARADGVRPGDFRKIDREIERRTTRPG